jgi:hypothetical protein
MLMILWCERVVGSGLGPLATCRLKKTASAGDKTRNNDSPTARAAARFRQAGTTVVRQLAADKRR